MGVGLAILLASCGVESPQDAGAVVHRDLPAAGGMRIEARLGAAPEVDGVAFAGVRGLGITPEGESLVLDGRGAVLHRFDSLGRHRGTLGRAGEGPGELGIPIGLHVDLDGGVWVADLGSGSLFRRGVDGNIDTWPFLLSAPPGIWVGGVDATGAAVFRITVGNRIPQAQDRTPAVIESAFPVGVVRWRPGSPGLDTLVLDGVPRRGLDLIRAGAVFPFQAQRLTAPAPDGSIWTAVSDGYRIVRLDASGDTLLDLQASVAPLPITSAGGPRWSDVGGGGR